MLFLEHHVLTHIHSGGGDLLAERISNHYLVRESFTIGILKLYISSNENDQYHSARAHLPGHYKRQR